MADSNSTIYFTGFSTVGVSLSKNWTLYDVPLVRRDLLNHFNTRVGERVMRPTWGCKIWDYLMEPLTSGMTDLITAEALRVCQSDQRVVVQNIQVTGLDSGVRIDLTLFYQPQNVVDSFYIDFENRQDAEVGFQ